MKIINICLITILYNMTNNGVSQDIQIPSSYLWKSRVILVFSSDQNDFYQRQMDIFSANKAGLEERDIVIFSIKKQKVKGPDEKTYRKEEAEQLRKQYQVDSDTFSVVLIGKDGTEKLQQNELLSTNKLFAVVDAMPMRRSEMREEENNGN
ncbi:DUF4174 domain-containing protein [Catalinimonas niigatensis]|uniref:DUF4174 domain-containing protein n=1 Tax=Catalinimonas niigatensis TaxID=1397264 RepID=UPI002664E86C|nr:DUF4174 domain-containing protein [Catalinimonas niigatensis]WPP48902.1 DUF4174 domain-containing protein [Catalinimonas niigatensis]